MHPVTPLQQAHALASMVDSLVLARNIFRVCHAELPVRRPQDAGLIMAIVTMLRCVVPARSATGMVLSVCAVGFALSPASEALQLACASGP